MSVIFAYDCLDCGSHDEHGPAGGHLSCTCADPDPTRLMVQSSEGRFSDRQYSMVEIHGRPGPKEVAAT